MSIATRQSVSSMNQTAHTRFQSLCRAAVLLARTADLQRHLRDNPQPQLHLVRELANELYTANDHASLDCNDTDPVSWLTALAPLGLTWSAMYSLLDKICCPEQITDESGLRLITCTKSDDEVSMQTHAFALLQSCTQNILTMLTNIHMSLDRIREHQSDNTSLVSPLIFDSIYNTAMTCLWIREESGDRSAAWNLGLAQQSLDLLGSRWRSGREYLTLVNAQEQLAS